MPDDSDSPSARDDANIDGLSDPTSKQPNVQDEFEEVIERPSVSEKAVDDGLEEGVGEWPKV
jgi:hypothetical protein